MENIYNNDILPEEIKGGENLTPKNESVIEAGEMNGHSTKQNSDEFLKREGDIKNENVVLEGTINHESMVHNEVGSISSSNLIKSESLASSGMVEIDDHQKARNEPIIPTVQESGEANGNTHVSTDNELNMKETVKDDKTEEKAASEKSASEVGDPSEAVGIVSLDGDDTTEKMTDCVPSPSEKVESPSSSCVEDTSSDSNKEPAEEWMDILGSGHLMKKVLKPGVPNARPQKSDVCILSLIGKLEDGTVVEKAEQLEINLSDNEVIQGLDFALALMDKGEEAEIKVSPRFGYGSLGKKPEIPPGANLTYNVILHDVREEPQINTLSVADRIRNGLRKKERGNWWYARDENTLAINCYRRALDYLDDTDIAEPHTEEDVRKLLEERLKTYNNLGAAQMKISAFDAALMSVNNVLTSQPDNVKALFRKSKILKEKGELQESINVVKQALSYEPDSQTLQHELSSLMAAQRKANTKQRELYKKMMGNSNNQADEEKKKSSKNNYKTFTLVAAVSFAVAVLGTIVVKYKF